MIRVLILQKSLTHSITNCRIGKLDTTLRHDSLFAGLYLSAFRNGSTTSSPLREIVAVTAPDSDVMIT